MKLLAPQLSQRPQGGSHARRALACTSSLSKTIPTHLIQIAFATSSAAMTSFAEPSLRGLLAPFSAARLSPGPIMCFDYQRSECAQGAVAMLREKQASRCHAG